MSPTPNNLPLDPSDPTSLALAMTRLQGDHTILQREVATNIQNLTACITALQADSRHLSEQLADVVRLQQQQVSHSEGLDRAFKAIEKLTTRIETWIEKHEGENRTTADCVTRFQGGLSATRWAAGILWGLLVIGIGALGAWAKGAIEDARNDRVRIEAQLRAAHDADTVRLQGQIDTLRMRVDGASEGAR